MNTDTAPGPLKRILFIEPRSPAEHVFSRTRIPRLGTILLGTILRDIGYEARVLIEEVSGTVRSADLAWADAVCVSSTTSTAPRGHDLGARAAGLGKTVVYGGPHDTFLPEEGAAHGGIVVRGEGEETLVELLAALNGGGDLSRVRGISYRQGGRLRHTPDRPLVADLDALPIPDFGLVRGWNPRRRVVPVATSRGCPFNCRFCSVVPMFGRGYRTRSVDHVISEVKANAGGARHLFFCDDNFFANPRRAKELLRRLRDEGIETQWSTQVRVESALDTEFLELLRETNCFAVYIGFESANPGALKAYRKRQGVDDMRRAIENFHRFGIHIHGMFIFGADEDTPETIRETARFAAETGIDSVQFLHLTPLPGTEVFREFEASKRLLTRDWSLYDGSHAVFRPAAMTADELQEAWYRAYLSFYSRWSILRRFARFDLFYGYIRLYARRLVKRGRSRIRDYRRGLVRDLVAAAQERFAAAWSHRGARRVTLLPGNASEAYHRFLERFLNGLGVEVLSGGESPELIARIREKVGLVVVPLLRERGVPEKLPSLDDLVAAVRDRLPSGLPPVRLEIDLDRESLYQACVQFGLLFSTNVKKIRRAYRDAFSCLEDEAALLPSPG